MLAWILLRAHTGTRPLPPSPAPLRSAPPARLWSDPSDPLQTDQTDPLQTDPSDPSDPLQSDPLQTDQVGRGGRVPATYRDKSDRSGTTEVIARPLYPIIQDRALFSVPVDFPDRRLYRSRTL